MQLDLEFWSFFATERKYVCILAKSLILVCVSFLITFVHGRAAMQSSIMCHFVLWRYCFIVSGQPKRDTVTGNSIFRPQYSVEGVVWKG